MPPGVAPALDKRKVRVHGMTETTAVRNAVEKHVAELEQRCGRVTACRVVVNAPSHRHRSGGLYEVHIRLALPEGREVNVERTPPANGRHASLTFAIDDAFRHARQKPKITLCVNHLFEMLFVSF